MTDKFEFEYDEYTTYLVNIARVVFGKTGNLLKNIEYGRYRKTEKVAEDALGVQKELCDCTP